MNFHQARDELLERWKSTRWVRFFAFWIFVFFGTSTVAKAAKAPSVEQTSKCSKWFAEQILGYSATARHEGPKGCGPDCVCIFRAGGWSPTGSPCFWL